MRKNARIALYFVIAVLAVVAATSLFFVVSGTTSVFPRAFGALDMLAATLPLIGICVMSLFIGYRNEGKRSK